MSKLTEGERLVALETKMDTVLENQKAQSQEFKDLNGKLDLLLPTYATKQDLQEMRRKNNLQLWLTTMLAAIFSSVVTFLVMFFLTNMGGK